MAITLRLVKGSELTFAEVDDNFKSLFYSASLDGNELKLFYYPGTSFESVDLSSISTDTGSFLITGSIANGTITLEKGDGTTFDLIYNTGSFSGSFTGDAGLYSGNGTIPLNTTASVNGDLLFQGLDDDTRLIVKDGNNGGQVHLFSDGNVGISALEFYNPGGDTFYHKIQQANSDTRYVSNGRDLIFSTNTASFSEGIFVQSGTGNLGIGTTTPEYTLDVLAKSGSSNFEDVVRVGVDDTADSFVITNGVSTDGTFAPVLRSYQTSSTQPFFLQGTIATAVDTGSNPVIRIQGRASGSGWEDVINRPIVQFSNNATKLMTIAAGGNVGIGTESPSQSLHIQSSGPTSVLVDSQTTDNAQLILQHSNTGGSGLKNSAVVFKRDSTTYWTVGLNGTNGASNNEFVIANGTSFDVSPILVINQSSGNTGLGLGAGNNPTNILELGGANSNYSSLRIVTQSATPSSPQNGQLRNDNGTPYWYDGTSWIDLSATGSGGGGATFPYTGSAEITGSLSVTGSTTLSGSGNQILTVEGSGSSNPIFTVNGSLGELFTVTDSLSGSLFAVNNISGLSILDVQSDNRILMGNPTYPSLNTTVRFSATASGNIIYEIPTSSYEGAFFEYTVQSASNARAGSIMTTWIPGTSNIVSTETTTTDIGSTSGVSFTTIITGSNIALTASVGDDTWIVKTIVRSI